MFGLKRVSLIGAMAPSAWALLPTTITCTELINLRNFGLRCHQAATSPAAHHQQHCTPSGPATAHHAVVLDGRAVAAAWQEELARDVREVVARGGRPPGLGVLLVGNRPDSLLYVTRKREACERVGIYSDLRHMPPSVSQREVEACVRELCCDPRVDGVLVQLPLPQHINEEAIIESMDPFKDVDGFHPLNMGRTLMRGRTSRFIPCTPLGIMQLLERSGVATLGKTVVVMGDSNIVGMPLAMLFRDSGCATVTVIHRTSYRELFADSTCTIRAEQRAQAEACLPRIPGPLARHASAADEDASPSSGSPVPAAHPYEVSYASHMRSAYNDTAMAGAITEGMTPGTDGTSAVPTAAASAQPPQQRMAPMQLQDLPAMTRTADILVVAVGYPHLVKRDWVKSGAVVIDVGINVVEGWGPDEVGEHGNAQAGAGRREVEQQQQQKQQQYFHHHYHHSNHHQVASTCEQAHHPFHVVGDVDFDDVSAVASCITPVPGGVGPMTIAAVLHNTVQAAVLNLLSPHP